MMKECLVLGIALLFTNYAVIGGGAIGERRILQSETVYDITSYGAKGDGTTDDAMVLMNTNIYIASLISDRELRILIIN